MDLKTISESISKSIKDLKVDLQEQKVNKLDELDRLTTEYKIASAQGDRSENAAFTEAVDGMSKCTSELASINKQIALLDNLTEEDSYEPINLVVLFSTVRLKVIDTGEEFVYKLYPEGISDLERKIISEDSPVGKLLMRKEVGDIISIEMPLQGKVIKYQVIDIY